jgi:hypothetical protein
MHIQARLVVLPLLVDAFVPLRSTFNHQINNIAKYSTIQKSRPSSSAFGYCRLSSAKSQENENVMASSLASVSKFLSRLPVALLLISAATLSLPEESSAVLSNEQRVVAEAWSIVDSTFVDRTFNNNDWLKIRQTLVKKQYNSREEVRFSALKLENSAAILIFWRHQTGLSSSVRRNAEKAWRQVYQVHNTHKI